MFGSLVFVLPFEHQGGNLVLHHRTRKFNFDSPSLLQGAPPLSVAYVAFYNDVEHEVLEVTAGHRVTVTFNLYFDSFRAPPIVSELEGGIPENPLTVTLRELFRDAAFIHDRIYLGFGLEYDNYKCKEDVWYYNELKGPDAFLFQIMEELGLNPRLHFLYESEHGSCGFWVLSSAMVAGRDWNEPDNPSTELTYLLHEYEDAIIVWAPGESENTLDKDSENCWVKTYFMEENIETCREWTYPVIWVTKPTEILSGKTELEVCLYDPPTESFPFRVCIIVDTSVVPCPLLPER